jgi:hypothetical protein
MTKIIIHLDRALGYYFHMDIEELILEYFCLFVVIIRIVV